MFKQSNRHLHENFKKGKEFIYSLGMSYNANNTGDANTNSTNVPIPLFAPNMFETLYNEITNNQGNAYPTALGQYVGVANYGANIWDALAQFNLGGINHTTLYPYNGPDISGTSYFFTNDFFMKIANGSILNSNENILSGWLKIVSQKMAYLNFLRTLQTKKVHCSNINFQWIELQDTPTQLRNNGLIFFDQTIDGNITSDVVTINQYFKPSNLNSRIFIDNGIRKQSFNIDVPCDWIFSASSGVSIGWDCLNYYDVDGTNQLNVSFTLHEIK